MPKSAASHSSVALTGPADLVILPASLASAGAAPAPPTAPASAPAASAARVRATLRRSAGTARRLRAGAARGGRRLHVVGLGLLEALLGPRLVELDAHPALLVLHQRQARPEGAPRPALEAGDRLLGLAARDELLGDRRRQVLARLGLPDDEAAARVLTAPARVALAVLDDVAPADRARAEVGPRDPHVLELGVELVHRGAREAGDVVHELLARVLPVLDVGQPVLPVAGHHRRGQRVLAEQADHAEPLLGAHERAPLALHVADVDQALDDRRARGGRADPGVLHRLAQLVVLDQLAGGLHRAQQRRVGVAARRLGDLLLGAHLEHGDVLAALELGQRLVR